MVSRAAAVGRLSEEVIAKVNLRPMAKRWSTRVLRDCSSSPLVARS